ncbi:hypothetical protein [Algoriphagus yeomjeoni]|uniref:Uncharacterized protein n=1 Tax=Algoriphagus yeomjeoni TaxID=291403 RepID=A0A327PGQ4_9BACT|nr:hypothetical protein [Algoriphagus yeomjeoni]RAI91415.1 hypothetical protein LV83_01600 [Algoriphagus yeomjeoni]
MEKGSFLNYYKTILEKVSFDSSLLEKEYKKAQALLDGSESQELDYWLNSSGLVHKIRCFSSNNTGGNRSVD